MERQCGREGAVRRAQRRPRRGGEAQLHQAQRGVADLHRRGHRLRPARARRRRRPADHIRFRRHHHRRRPALLLIVMLGLSLVYRFGPSCSDARWRWITWGSASAAVLWLIASVLFSWYAANFGSYNKTYGSLGAIIGFMGWIWSST